MNEFWNLDALYKGFDDPAFQGDMEKLSGSVDRMCDFSRQLSAGSPLETLRTGIALEEEIARLVSKLVTFASLRQAVDTRDTQAGSQLGRVFSIVSGVAGAQAAFRDWAGKLPDLMELVRSDEVLRSYEYLFSNIRENSRYLLPGLGEEIIARMEMSGGNAWSELQGYLTSTVPVTYRGTETTLSAVRNLAYDPDPQVRKDAYEAELACYHRIRDAVAFALNSIKLERISQCKLRGYESPLDFTLRESHVKRETLDAMLAAMGEFMPKFWQYLRAKAKLLGHEKGLPWYDLFAPVGYAGKKYTAQEMRDYLVSLFAGFDKELSDMVARAFDEAWIDFYPRSGKQGGAFCANLETLGQSRVMLNFDGSFSDIVTAAHELGHAFHNQCIRDHRILNMEYSMPVAETASTFNECVVMASAIQNAGDKNEKLALIESQLQDATQIICDIYSRFLFEAKVFENREDQFMDADTLCGMMLDAQKRAYGDGLDPDCLHSYMWVCKSHYYGPTFYNYPYAFGGLFARGLYARYEQEGADFVPKYKRLLYTTTVADAEDTAKVAGIDLTDKDFWRSALKTIADQIDLFCSLVEE